MWNLLAAAAAARMVSALRRRRRRRRRSMLVLAGRFVAAAAAAVLRRRRRRRMAVGQTVDAVDGCLRMDGACGKRVRNWQTCRTSTDYMIKANCLLYIHI